MSRLLRAHDLAAFSGCVVVVDVQPRARSTARGTAIRMIPDGAVERVQRWADARVPDHVRDQVRLDLDVTDRTITIFECRPQWHPAMGDEWTRFPVARLRYTRARGEWSLYRRDRNRAFHRYDLADPSAYLEDLLDEIDADPTAIFWG